MLNCPLADMSDKGPTVYFPRQYLCRDDPNTLYLHARCEMQVGVNKDKPELESRWLKDGMELSYSSHVCTGLACTGRRTINEALLVALRM